MRTCIGNQERIRVGRRTVITLRDLVPERGPIRMLIIGKTPLPESVEAGHYFQGSHGQFLWGELRRYGLLRTHDGECEDDALIRHGYGITDVVKAPRASGDEPSAVQYRAGWPAVAAIIERLEPELLFWPYKGALDTVVRRVFGLREKARYGFNPKLNRLFGARVFAFGMPGTPCRSETREASMRQLRRVMRAARHHG